MKFDKLSLGGLLLSLVAIVGGQALEGGHLASILQFTAFLIVIGGTLGAVMLQSTLPVFLQALRALRWVFKPQPIDRERLLHQILEWSQAARRGGLLALENQLDVQRDPLARKGLQMLVDGMEPEQIRRALEAEVDHWVEYEKLAAKVWEAAGGYAPTVGILGAVLGLIHVMENLSDPSKLGGGIATAFVATVYGVGSANLLFLPMANKIKFWIGQQAVARDMLIQGLCCIAAGENPRLIESKLSGLL